MKISAYSKWLKQGAGVPGLWVSPSVSDGLVDGYVVAASAETWMGGYVLITWVYPFSQCTSGQHTPSP